MKTLEELKKQAVEEAKARISNIEHDYRQAIEDCRNGIYDKWFRYHRNDDGSAYDSGWMQQNHITKNESVLFIGADSLM